MTERRDPELTDLKRRVANGVMIGTVSQVDHELNRYRVKIGPLETDWIPTTVTRSGRTKVYTSRDVGEQVVVASPSGDLSQAVIIGSMATDETQNGTKASEHRTTYADGTVVEYDDEAKTMNVKLAAGGSSNVEVGGASLKVSESGISITVGGVTLAVSAAGVEVTGGQVKHNGHDIGETHKHRDSGGAGLGGIPE